MSDFHGWSLQWGVYSLTVFLPTGIFTQKLVSEQIQSGIQMFTNLAVTSIGKEFWESIEQQGGQPAN